MQHCSEPGGLRHLQLAQIAPRPATEHLSCPVDVEGGSVAVGECHCRWHCECCHNDKSSCRLCGIVPPALELKLKAKVTTHGFGVARCIFLLVLQRLSQAGEPQGHVHKVAKSVPKCFTPSLLMS